jgi:hypothetical protein
MLTFLTDWASGIVCTLPCMPSSCLKGSSCATADFAVLARCGQSDVTEPKSLAAASRSV